MAKPIRLIQYISLFHSLFSCHRWVSVVTFMVCILLFYTLFLMLSAKIKTHCCSLQQVWRGHFIFINNISLRPRWKKEEEEKKRNAKLHPALQKQYTTSRYMVPAYVEGLSFFFFLNSVALHCQRLPCKLVLKMNAFMFWFGPTE